MYEGFEEEVVVVGGGGVVEEGGMVGVAGVFDKEVFGLGVFIFRLCNRNEGVSGSAKRQGWLQRTGGQLVQLVDQKLLISRPGDFVAVRAEDISKAIFPESCTVCQCRYLVLSPPLGLGGI